MGSNAIIRALDKFTVDDGCWLWLIPGHDGYGRIGLGGRDDGVGYAHRVVYEALRAPIPDGLQIDHLCRQRACVRPSHLEPTTHRENTLRGVNFIAVNAKTAGCPQDHPYNETNTYVDARGSRACRTCRRERTRIYKAARRHTNV